MFRRNYIYSLVIIISLLSAGCSTKKNKLLNRTYHNVTARFNGFFYAEESIKEGVLKIEKAHKEDYTKILPVFIYADAQDAKNIYPEMDRAIKKASVVIQRHTITDRKEKEIPGAVKWTDENYLVIGRAHFYKHDFFSALESFEYVSKVYENNPSRYKAMMWMIRTYNEIGSFSMSQPILDFLNNDKDFPKNFNAEFETIKADYFIKRANYDAAIKHLSKAVSLTKKKKLRSRYAFILAQLYEKQNDAKSASRYYDQVVRSNPAYDMLFNARINRARIYDAKSEDSKAIKKMLIKMLKDEKNKEYQDQIYYALAEIEEKEKNIPAAVDYLKLSVKNSISNNNQKAFSYLKLADIHFFKPDYPKAESYYDSTMLFLAKDYPNYELIADKKKSLNDLVKNLNTISMEDSLQRLALMSEAERNKVIENIIAGIEEEERRKQEEKEVQQSNADNNNFIGQGPGMSGGNSTAEGSWYFYNPATLSFGMNEFNMNWGPRKLEDNWRRSNKESLDFVVEQTEEEVEPGMENMPVNASTTDLKNKEYYLKNIPLSQRQMAESNKRIVEAFYNTGSIYKEQLTDNVKSSEAFEELIKRFPKNKHELSVYYQLYRIYLALNNKEKAEYYKNILLRDYPDTEYARIIKNPDYFAETKASHSVVEKFYTDTYEAYRQGEYQTVINNCQQAESLYARNSLMPKFDYLKALAIGRTQDINAFEKALTQVIIKHPKDEIKNKAQEMLDLIKAQKGLLVPDTLSSDTTEEKIKFSFNKDATYYWVIVVKNNTGDVNQFKISLSDLNSKFFSLEGLTINGTFLDRDRQLILVKKLNRKDKAMDYYNVIKNDEDVFKSLEPNSYFHFVISEENYSLLIKGKNTDEYMAFFKEKYLPE